MIVQYSKAYLALVRIILGFAAVFGLLKSPSETTGRNYTLYTRDDWGAPPITDNRPLSTPVAYVMIHHTYIPEACYTRDDCFEAMQSMQEYHASLSWGDIGYNFCVGSEGGAYVGRGWDIVGIHAGTANNFSVALSLIGDWREELPPKIQLDTTRTLIQEGLALGVISPDYKLIGHRQASATECPGDALFQEISTWDHYDPEPFSIPTS